MISREDCARLAAPLREHRGIARVMVARSDGVAHYDDAVLEVRERGAASAATAAGMAAIVATGLGVASPEGLVIYAGESQVIVRPLGHEAVLAVVAALGDAGDGAYRLVRRVARELDAALAEQAARADVQVRAQADGQLGTST